MQVRTRITKDKAKLLCIEHQIIDHCWFDQLYFVVFFLLHQGLQGRPNLQKGPMKFRHKLQAHISTVFPILRELILKKRVLLYAWLKLT